MWNFARNSHTHILKAKNRRFRLMSEWTSQLDLFIAPHTITTQFKEIKGTPDNLEK